MSKIGDLIADALYEVGLFIKKILPSSRSVLTFTTGVVNGIKKFDDANPEVGDIITAIIPGDTDNIWLAKVRQYLPGVMVGLSLATAEANKSDDQIVAEAIKLIKSKTEEYAASHYQDIWIHLAKQLNQNGISEKDLRRLSQVWYEQVSK